MDRFINLLFSLDTVFTRSSDPFVTEHRRLQRHCVLSAAVTLGSVMMAFVLMPASEVGPYDAIVRVVTLPISGFFLLVTLASAIWMAWAVYTLWRFERD